MTEKQIKAIQEKARKQTIENLIEWIGSEDAMNSAYPNSLSVKMAAGDEEEVGNAMGAEYEQVMGQVLALLKSMQNGQSVPEIPSNRRKIGQAIVLFDNEGEVLEVVKLRKGETAEDAFAKIADNDEYFKEDGSFEENILTEIID